MSDIEKARRLFQKAGLGFPAIPQGLAASLKEQGKWLFSTRQVGMIPYNLQYYVREVNEAHVEDYALLCHSGHGVNSYAIQYYLVHGPLAMFLHLGWGGVYMDNEAAAAKIRECFSLGDKLVLAAQTSQKLTSYDRVTIVACDFYGSYWSSRKKRGEADRTDLEEPKEALSAALCWLESL